MKYSQLSCAIWVGTVASAIVALPVNAEETRLQDFNRPATTIKEWLAQVEETKNEAPVPVTDVQLNRLETELEIVLETQAGRSLQIDATKFRTEGTSLIATIGNAVLSLPNTQEFTSANPTPEIASVQVTQVDASTIQVRVTGTNAVPSEEITLRTGDLSYSLNPEGETPEEELVVTGKGQRGYSVPNASIGTGTDTPILETPFSVQAVPQEVLRDQQVIRLEDALTNISGVGFAGTNSGRETKFSIRGFGNQFNEGAPILRDGYRIYGNFQGISEIGFLDRIEVLKGPASILYGEIEPGGIINLVSKKPLSQPFYEAEFQVGSREFVRPRFDFSGPLTADGDLAYRLNALFQHDRSFRNFTTDTNRVAVSPALSWKVGDRTDLNLNLEYIHQTGPADFGITQFGDGVAPVSRDFVANNPDDSITTDYFSTGYSFEHRFSDNWKIRNGFRYISYDYDYSVVALPFIVDGPDIIRFFADQDGQQRSYSLFTNTVGKFATGSIKHVLTAGVDLNRSEARIFTLFGDPTPLNIFNPDYNLIPKPSRSTLPLFSDTLTTANRLAIYLQDQVYLLDNLILVAGLRYDTITQRTTNVETNFTAGGDAEQTNDAVTPRVGLLYRPIPELAFFANYSQSFRPSTSLTVNGSPLQPEEGEGFEVGVKTELLNQKLLATFTYFNITKQNVGVADPNNPLFSIAIGEQESQGIEFDIAGEILPGWKVIGSYAYIDATVSRDTDETIVGNRLFGVPKNKASLWTTYEIQQGSFRGFGFGVGFEYASDRFGDLANSFRVGDYLIGNAALFYRRDNYRFAVNFRNITNANYVRALTGNEGGIEPGEPLSVIGSISVQF